MELSELAAYAEEKYHMKEEHKWAAFPGFSVLTDPRTDKWVALLMRQWDYETGTELQRCDIKCGRECLTESKAPYLTGAFRMKGPKWVGIRVDNGTDPETVFALFDRAVRAGEQGYTVVLEERPGADGRDYSNGRTYSGGRKYHDTLLPLEALRGNYRKGPANNAAQRTAGRNSGAHTSAQSAASQRTAGRSSGAEIPPRILEMMQLYEFRDGSFENKCRNFLRQGRFMEDYEDNVSWGGEFKRYFTTYHDLNLNLLRGYFSWRSRIRKGEYHRITTSLAYMYIYELLGGIGVASPEDSLRLMKEFESGYLDSGIGDPSMRENLRRWRMEFAVMHGSSAEEVLPFLDDALLERDRFLMILKHADGASDEEVCGALCGLSDGKIEKSPVIKKDPVRGKHLFAEVWRYMAANYIRDGWDIFTACFGKLRQFPWHPLANAVYLDVQDRKETVYTINECRKYQYKDGKWSECRYDDLYFDRYRIHALLHEADRQLRRYLKTGSYLRAKQGEEWVTPYVEAVIEADRAAAIEAAKPKIAIDLSGLDKIRRDAMITQNSLLTEEEKREQMEPQEEKLEQPQLQEEKFEQPQPREEKFGQPQPREENFDRTEPREENQYAAESEIRIPSLDPAHTQILLAVMRGESVAERIRQHHLMPSVVTDAINEALFDEIGDNVLECEGDEISFVEDYREDVEFLAGG